MSFELWTAFTLASLLLLALPGPTVVLVVNFVLFGGRRSMLLTVPAVTLGYLTAITLSLLGVGALLALSAELFAIFKLVGALYLVWLGFKIMRLNPSAIRSSHSVSSINHTKMFFKVFAATALSPKGIVIGAAFAPQFIDVNQPVFVQLAFMEATFIGIAALNVILWALLANKARSKLLQSNRLGLFNKLSGGFMIGAGIFIAAFKRSP